MIRILGVSMPRSGHHYLSRLLVNLLPEDFHYCEVYKEVNCCKEIPCSRANNVVFQKSHDFDFSLPIMASSYDGYDIAYLIQYRNPLYSVLSDRELYLKIHPEYKNDRNNYSIFLADKAFYYIKFHDKWLKNPPPNSLAIDYEDLLNNPDVVLKRIVNSLLSYEISDKQIYETVEEMKLVSENNEQFRPRSLETSEFFDEELLALFLSLLSEKTDFFEKWNLYPRKPLDNTLIKKHFEFLCNQSS